MSKQLSAPTQPPTCATLAAAEGEAKEHMLQRPKQPVEQALSEQAQRVKEFVLAQIFRSELPEGAKIVEQDLKTQTGAPFLAVRQALMALAREGILERRRKLGTFVSLKKPSNRPGPVSMTKLGLITSLPQASLERNTYTAEVLEGMKDAMEGGHEVVFYANRRSSRPAIEDLPAVKPDDLLGSVQGVIALEANNAPVLNNLVRAGVPLVAIDYLTPQALYDSVSVDHREAGYLVTTHLLAMGHRRIGFIGEAPNLRSSDPTWQDRLSGYLHAMSEVLGAKGQFWMLDVRRNPDLIGAALPEFQRTHRLTAYVLCSGTMRDDALNALAAMNISVPKDISLAAADACTKEFPGGNLTCININYGDLGRMAVNLLGSRLACRAMPPVRATLPAVMLHGHSSMSLVTEHFPAS